MLPLPAGIIWHMNFLSAFGAWSGWSYKTSNTNYFLHADFLRYFFFGCFRLSFLVAVRVAILISTFHWSFRYDGMISFGPVEINLRAIKTPKYFNGFICSRRMTNFRLSFIGSQKPLTINVAVYTECINFFLVMGVLGFMSFGLDILGGQC